MLEGKKNYSKIVKLHNATIYNGKNVAVFTISIYSILIYMYHKRNKEMLNITQLIQKQLFQKVPGEAGIVSITSCKQDIHHLCKLKVKR